MDSLKLDNTFGAWFIGSVVAAVLYGCVLIQAWFYFTHYSSDRWFVKILVAAVLVSETCHQIMVTHFSYTYLVTHYGELTELIKIDWSGGVALIFNGSSIFLVQCFMAIRIYRLSKKNWIVTGSVAIIALCQFSLILALASKALRFNTFIQLAKLKTYTRAMNATSASGDLYISLLLCSLLHMSRTGFRKSDTLISRLILFSINTGLLTSFCAIASLISISAWPDTFIYMACYMSVSRTYTCALLVTLNARKALREESQADGISYGQLSHPMSKLGTASSRIGNNVSIRVDTKQEYMRDKQYSPCGDVKKCEVA